MIFDWFIHLFQPKPKRLQVYELAMKDLNEWEWAGSDHNPKIVKYFADVGHDWVKDDETAWCAAYLGAMLERSGVKSTRKLNARSYLDFGTPVRLENARRGDIVVFSRGGVNSWKGHVAFYVSHSDTHVNVLGGNQSDQVNIQAYPRLRLLGVRRY